MQDEPIVQKYVELIDQGKKNSNKYETNNNKTKRLLKPNQMIVMYFFPGVG